MIPDQKSSKSWVSLTSALTDESRSEVRPQIREDMEAFIDSGSQVSWDFGDFQIAVTLEPLGVGCTNFMCVRNRANRFISGEFFLPVKTLEPPK